MSNDLDTIKPIIANALQPEQMDRHAIMSRALRHGFTLRPQEGRPDDLNEYVYSFAREVFEAGQKAGSAEINALREDLECERMRLVACGVVASADTPESAAKAREMHKDYRSASCDDVARCVDECMALRKERDALAAKLAELRWIDELFPSEAFERAGLRMPTPREFGERISQRYEKKIQHLESKLAELEGQEPVGRILYRINKDPQPYQDYRLTIRSYEECSENAYPKDWREGEKLYRRPIPAEPVNARLLEALKDIVEDLELRSNLKRGEDKGLVDVGHGVYTRARAAIAAAEAQGVTGPKRLTDEEIMGLLASIDENSPKDPSFFMIDPLTFARAIEAAALSVQEAKNGD